MSDWTGNSNSVYKTLGASNHVKNERQKNDFYVTEQRAAKLLFELETFSNNILECACGNVSLSKVFESAGYMGGIYGRKDIMVKQNYVGLIKLFYKHKSKIY